MSNTASRFVSPGVTYRLNIPCNTQLPTQHLHFYVKYKILNLHPVINELFPSFPCFSEEYQSTVR